MSRQIKWTYAILPFFIGLSALSISFGQIPLGELYLPEGGDSKRGPADHLYISITNNTWINGPKGTKVRLYSPGFDISLTTDFWIKKGLFSIGTGIALSSYNIHSNATFGNCGGSVGKSGACLTPLPANYAYKKNKISANYVDIPLEIRFKRTFKKPLRVYAGFKFGYLFNAHDKLIDNTGKYKNLNLKGFNQWRYGGYMIVGYHQFNLFWYCSFSPLLKNNENKLIPMSAGITFFII